MRASKTWYSEWDCRSNPRLCENADPDIPILQHAKAEYAKLK